MPVGTWPQLPLRPKHRVPHQPRARAIVGEHSMQKTLPLGWPWALAASLGGVVYRVSGLFRPFSMHWGRSILRWSQNSCTRGGEFEQANSLCPGKPLLRGPRGPMNILADYVGYLLPLSPLECIPALPAWANGRDECTLAER